VFYIILSSITQSQLFIVNTKRY